jgi:hypothetical protein
MHGTASYLKGIASLINLLAWAKGLFFYLSGSLFL